MNKYSAYSFLEVLITVGIISAIAMFVFPFAISAVKSERSSAYAADLASSMFYWQQNAYARKDGESYGIRFGASSYTLFVGDSYDSASRTEIYTLVPPSVISQVNLDGGVSDILFPVGSFRPDVDGNIIISDGLNNYIVEINSEGLINHYKQ